MTEQVQRFATGSPKGCKFMVHEIIYRRCLPLNQFMVSQTEWFFLLKFFNRWWWRRQIIQKWLKKWLSTQNPVHHLPPLFRTPVEKKTNKTNNKKTHLNKKTTNQAQAFQPSPPPKKNKKKINTIFHRGYYLSGWQKFWVGSFPHCVGRCLSGGLWGWPIPCGPHHWKEGTGGQPGQGVCAFGE